MTATRQTITTITALAATPTLDGETPIPTARPATRPLVEAVAAADAEPFQALLTSLTTHFDGDIDAALDEDETAALADIDRIIGEHLHTARVLLAAATPVIDWTDRAVMADAVSVIARRAAAMRIVEVLGA